VTSPIKAWRCWGGKGANPILPFSREAANSPGLHR
jgi:hypothetical protein